MKDTVFRLTFLSWVLTQLVVPWVAGQSLASESRLNPHLFKIEYQGRSSWILGTMHTHKLRLDEFYDVQNAIKESRLFVGEEDVTKVISGARREHIAPPNETVEALLDSDSFARLSYFLRKNIPIHWGAKPHEVSQIIRNIFQLRLGYVYMIFMNILMDEEISHLRNVGLSAMHENSLDHQLYEFAKNQNKLLSGFRHPDFIRDEFFLKKINLQDLKVAIANVLEADGSIKASDYDAFVRFRRWQETNLAEAIRMYKEGLPVAQLKSYLEQFSSPLGFNDPIINNPTQKIWQEEVKNYHRFWYADLFRYVEMGQIFMAVGVDHVEGDETTLIEVLKKRFGPYIKITRSTDCQTPLLPPAK